MNRISQSFKWALNGLKIAWVEEKNFQIDVIGATLALGLAISLDLSAIEFCLIVFACTIILGGEILNTAIEDLCDKVEHREDPIIKKVKDTMAGFVLISSLGSFLIGIIILLPKLLAIFS